MMNKEYTINDFRIKENSFDKIITESGSWSNYSNKWDINYSGILTKLIQVAGRYCELYASDLFIDWLAIENKVINNPDRIRKRRL